MSASGARQMAGKLGLLILSALLCLALVESALRAIAPDDEVAYVLDDELLFRPAPGRSRRFVRFPEHGGAVIETRFDRFGFRDEGRPGEDPIEGGIFVYGDSTVQASYSRPEDTFTGQLSRMLSDGGERPARVVNAGVDGYGPDQVLLRLGRDLPQHRPALLILVVYADNDFGDLVRNKLFRVGSDGELVRHDFSFHQTTRSHYEASARSNGRMRLLNVFLEPALIRRDLRILVERRLGWTAGWLGDVAIDTSFRADPGIDWIAAWAARGVEEYQSYVVEGDPWIRLDNIRSDHYDADITTRPGSEPARYKVRMMHLVLGEIAALLRRHETPLLLVILPSPIDACEGYDWQVDEGRHPRYRRRFLTSAVDQAAEALGLARLNLFDAFSGEGCNERFFHHGNNHWNEAGQHLAATLVAEQITRQSGSPADGGRGGFEGPHRAEWSAPDPDGRGGTMANSPDPWSQRVGAESGQAALAPARAATRPRAPASRSAPASAPTSRAAPRSPLRATRRGMQARR